MIDLTDKQSRATCRWMIQRDLPACLWIDSCSFAESWTEEDFRSAMRQPNVIGIAAEIGDEVVGYMIYCLEDDHIQLLRLAVSPDRRRQGIGMQMLFKLACKLSPRKRTRLLIDVPEDSLPAQLWLRALGVRATQVLRDEGCYRFEL